MMRRFSAAMGAGAFAALCVLVSPVQAITAKEKRATCEFGAENQKLAGAAKKSFMAKCMAADNSRAGRAKDKKAAPAAQ
jgi:hypothetical protein